MMAKITLIQLKQLVEATIFVADEPINKEQLQATVLDGLVVSNNMLKDVLEDIRLDYLARGIQLVEVSSGYRFQSMDSLSPWLSKLWQEQAPRYSRAMLEILSLIAYRQPITRGEIEDVRGVSVSSHIMKTLSERSWIKIVGHKEVPGRPALYATTKGFLDYFSLKSLSELPNTNDFVDAQINSELNILDQTMSNEQQSKDLTPPEAESNQSSEPVNNTANQEQIH
jgi:segregation and condensation protein B